MFAKRNANIILVSFILLGAVCASLAEPRRRQIMVPETKTAVAYRIPSRSVKIDGRLRENVWARIKGISGFIQHAPDEGAPSTQKTLVQIAYDDDALYIAVRAFDDHPEQIVNHLTRRDVLSPSDWVGFALDSYNDNRTATVFMTNPAGVQIDYKVTDDNFHSADYSWDAVWDVDAATYSNGWVAEFRIPLNQLRFANKGQMVWGFQAFRIVSRLNEESYWCHRPKDTSSFVSLFGRLVGLGNIKPSTGVQLLPYSRAIVDNRPVQQRHPDIPNPLNSYAIGLDAKIPIKNNITLDMTVNPDFGQVESDPSVYNLTDYEVFFEDRRPFFVENSEMFDFRVGISTVALNDGMLFYSRRIGRTPHIQYQSSPSLGVRQSPASRIIGAAKVSGKTDHGWSLGMIEAVTGQEKATLYSGGSSSEIVAEPLTNYFVSRLQKDFNDGNTLLGAIVTNVLREGGTSLSRTLPRSATTGGINFSHRWDHNTYDIKFSLMGSHVTGDTLAMQSLQKSSARYFQRPDADYVHYDPAKTFMSGFAGKFTFRKIGGNWNWALGGVTRSPGFEINDIGFLRRADFNGLFAWLEYSQFTPGDFIRYWAWSGQIWRAFNYSALPINQGLQSTVTFQLLNYWSFYYAITRNNEAYDPYLLRGGSAFLVPGHTQMLLQMSSDMRKPLHLSVSSVYEWDDSGFDSWYLAPTATIRPDGRFNMAITLLYQDGQDDLQYLTKLPSQNNHLLGRLNRATFYAIVRANLALTPKLTLQYYGMPYLSAGHYDAFHKIGDPRAPAYSDRLVPVTDPGFSPDFNYKDYQSNLVLRWEYLPGSTLYLVWSQRNTQFVGDDHFDLAEDMRNLFHVQPHNVFLIKLNKWFDVASIL